MSARPRNAPLVVAIGGSDPSSGAGIQADLSSLEELGVRAMTVVTAVTVQTGLGVEDCRALSPGLVARQLEVLLETFPVKVLKCGLLPSAGVARAMAVIMKKAGLPLVLDPVLKPSAGGRLTGPGVAAAIARDLLPITSVVTANIDEASVLGGGPVVDVGEMKLSAARLAEAGAGAVVVTGGDLPGRPVDVCLVGGRLKVMGAARLRPRYKMHGTGCAFASAIAAGLARGLGAERSIRLARAHVRSLIRRATPVPGSAVLLRQPRHRP